MWRGVTEAERRNPSEDVTSWFAYQGERKGHRQDPMSEGLVAHPLPGVSESQRLVLLGSDVLAQVVAGSVPAQFVGFVFFLPPSESSL